MADQLTGAWLEARLEDGPEVLSRRTREFIAAEPKGDDLSSRLARAARRALARAVAHPADRDSALDLLAADALVTLALAARVESEPEGLAAFAAAIRRAEEGSA